MLPSFLHLFLSTVCSRTTFGFCNDTNRLVDIHELLQAAKAHSLPGLDVCMSRDEFLLALRGELDDPGSEDWTILMLDFMLRRGNHSRTVQEQTAQVT